MNQTILFYEYGKRRIVVPIIGLVSYYKLESNSNDSYGTNHGVNTDVTYGQGKIGNGAVYNGSTSKTRVGNPINLQLSTGTVSAWIKCTAQGANHRAIVVKENAYGLFLFNGTLVFYNWGSFGQYGNNSTGINLADSLWHHVALVFESGTTLNYLYIDGVLRLTFSMSVASQSTELVIGQSNYVGQAFTGIIDEVGIYNFKLTNTEIAALYNNGNGVTI